MQNAIFLRRRRKLMVAPGAGGATVEQLATVQKEVAALGFVLSEALLLRLHGLSPQQLATFLRELLRDLKPMVGAHREHEPLFPGFPGQTMRMAEAELYLEAARHYVTLRRTAPANDDAADMRAPLLDGRAPEPVELGSKHEFEVICTQLAGSHASLSDDDKADLAWFVRQYRGDVLRLLPPKIPFRENLALVAALLIEHANPTDGEALMRAQAASATDVLRLAVALSAGDISLATPTRFAPMPRARRRLLLAIVDAQADAAEAMKRRPEAWKRLGEVLHPRESARRYPRAQAAFDALRNGAKVASFHGDVEAALNDGRTGDAIDRLSERPGDFARRLDHLLRVAAVNTPGRNDALAVLEGFTRVASQVSTPVLLQLLAHLRHRRRRTLRAFMPKGQVAKVYAMRDTRGPLPPGLSDALAARVEDTLVERFRLLPPLGACHLDPELAFHLVPTSQRSASRSLRTLARGSRMPLPDAKFLRLFLWWTNGRERTDIDLSAGFFRADFTHAGVLSYYNLRDYGCHHSGDIVDAPQGAAEFIDLDVEHLISRGIRFVVMSINAYTTQTFVELPECFAGWMARHAPDSGEPFEPRTVIDRVDLAADSRIALPAAFDLIGRRVLWMDVALKNQPRWNNLSHNLTGVSLMLRALIGAPKPDLYTLFALHARARGSVVGRRGDAQTVFGVDGGGVTPRDQDRIRAEFMA